VPSHVIRVIFTLVGGDFGEFGEYRKKERKKAGIID